MVCLVLTCVWWNCCESLFFSSSSGTWFTSTFRWQCLKRCLHHLFEDGCCSVQNSSYQLTKGIQLQNLDKETPENRLVKGMQGCRICDFPSRYPASWRQVDLAMPHACGQVASSTRQEWSLFVGNLHLTTNGAQDCSACFVCFVLLCNHAIKHFRISENRWCKQILPSRSALLKSLGFALTQYTNSECRWLP